MEHQILILKKKQRYNLVIELKLPLESQNIKSYPSELHSLCVAEQNLLNLLQIK